VLYNVTKEYRNPKDYAEKVILKKTKSKQNLATIRQLYNARKEESRQLVDSSRVNKELAKVMSNGIKQDTIDITTSLDDNVQPDIYLDPRRNTEVLQKLESIGVYLNIRGKKQIKLQRGKIKKGKREKYDKTIANPEGRPSAYKTTDFFQKIKRVMSKPEAQKLLYQQLKQSNLLYTYEKFMIEAGYHAIRMDETVAQKMSKSTDTNPVTDSAINSFRKHLLSLNDNELEGLAAKEAELSIERLKGDPYSLLGLFHL
jgi:hypothetical protein